MPTDLVFGISVAIRHDDWRTQRQASWGAGNVEVTAGSALPATKAMFQPMPFTNAGRYEPVMS